MTIGQALWSFALLAGVLTIIPGMNTTLVLRSALTQSRGYAYVTALGIATGTLIWGVAAALGAAALLAASEVAFTALKLVGAAYLIYVGVTMIVASFRRVEVFTEAQVKPSASLWTAFGRGLLTDLLNPKVGVFYMALIPQFIPPGVPPAGMGLLLALVHVAETLVWFSAIIFATSFAKRWLSSARVTRWIDRVTGGILIAFGAVLALESRP